MSNSLITIIGLAQILYLNYYITQQPTHTCIASPINLTMHA